LRAPAGRNSPRDSGWWRVAVREGVAVGAARAVGWGWGGAWERANLTQRCSGVELGSCRAEVGLRARLQAVATSHDRWAALSLCELVCEQTGWDEKRLFHDSIGKAWSWLNMAVSRRSYQ